MLEEALLFRRGTLALVRGDITALDVDVLVNAANSALSGGGGVDGAIHRAAGPELVESSRAQGPIQAGQAIITGGFRLKARHVVHAVGPVWNDGDSGELAALASAYAGSIELANSVQATSIAFPCISTGAYRFPFEQAMTIAIDTVDSKLDESGLSQVVFCCFSEKDERRYRHALQSRYP